MSYKLIISCHDEHPIYFQNKNFVYIQTGSANTDKKFKGMIQDNTGNNISSKNLKYNELTGQYWAWKNFDQLENPDYIGFMHYRRHFLFCENNKYPCDTWLPGSCVHIFPYVTESYKNFLSHSCILSYLKSYDCIVISPYNIKNLGSYTIRNQYASLPEQETKFFDIFIDSAKKLAPDYEKEIEMIEHGHIQYLCNMFIMHKNLFFRYNEFMFPILEDMEKRIDTTGFSEKKLRFLGFFGEFLLSIFIFKLQHEGTWKIKELHASFILSDTYVAYPKWKYFQYWLLSKITFGKLGKKFLHKKIEYRTLYRASRK